MLIIGKIGLVICIGMLVMFCVFGIVLYLVKCLVWFKFKLCSFLLFNVIYKLLVLLIGFVGNELFVVDV